MGQPARRREPPIPAAPRKRRRDVVVKLECDGRLDWDEAVAAYEIRALWEALSRSLFPRATDPARPAVQASRRAGRTPFDSLSAHEEARWRRRYKPWADEMSVEIVAGVGRTSRLQLVIDVVVDNWGLRQVETRYRLRHGRAIAPLRTALKRYAEMAATRRDGKGAANIREFES